MFFKRYICQKLELMYLKICLIHNVEREDNIFDKQLLIHNITQEEKQKYMLILLLNDFF